MSHLCEPEKYFAHHFGINIAISQKHKTNWQLTYDYHFDHKNKNKNKKNRKNIWLPRPNIKTGFFLICLECRFQLDWSIKNLSNDIKINLKYFSLIDLNLKYFSLIQSDPVTQKWNKLTINIFLESGSSFSGKIYIPLRLFGLVN